MYPGDLRYTKTHEWARLEKEESAVTVGVTEYAVKQLSDIVFLELPGKGDEVKKDSPFGAIESVKAVFDLNSPVTGQVIETNQALNDNLDLLKTNPYSEGWMIKVRQKNPEEMQKLMSSSDYEDFNSSS